MQLTTELVEAQSFGFDIVERDIRIENWVCAGAAAAKRSAEQSLDRIVDAEDGLNVLAGSALSVGFERPRAMGHEAPVAIELERKIDSDGGLPSLHRGSRELETIERVIEVSINFVELICVVLGVGRGEVAVKSGPGDGTENAAAKRDIAAHACGNSIRATQAIDEIIPVREILDLQAQFDGGIGTADGPIYFDLSAGSGDFALREQASLRVFRIIKQDMGGDGNRPGREGWRRRPAHVPLGAEMLEIRGPGIS